MLRKREGRTSLVVNNGFIQGITATVKVESGRGVRRSR